MTALEDFDRSLGRKNLFGYWNVGTGNAYAEPNASFEPCLWKWADVAEALEQAAASVGLDETFRRFIGFATPSLNKSTTHTLVVGAQLVKPGEIAEAHRHTMGAIRFVIRGGGAQTTVDGEPFPMMAGDLITTPGGSWHDHYNGSKQPVIWLDGADRPVIKFFQIGFHEPFGEKQQPHTRSSSTSACELGTVRPSWIRTTGSRIPPYRYSWEDAAKALRLLGEQPGDSHDGIVLRYVNPLTGGATLPTMSCELHMLRRAEETKRHRHTSTFIYHVFQGEGFTMIDNQRLEWQKEDTFTVPLWRWHYHHNSAGEETILFAMNDRPIMDALGFYREESG